MLRVIATPASSPACLILQAFALTCADGETQQPAVHTRRASKQCRRIRRPADVTCGNQDTVKVKVLSRSAAHCLVSGASFADDDGEDVAAVALAGEIAKRLSHLCPQCRPLDAAEQPAAHA